jgi:hypothetical protein
MYESQVQFLNHVMQLLIDLKREGLDGTTQYPDLEQPVNEVFGDAIAAIEKLLSGSVEAEGSNVDQDANDYADEDGEALMRADDVSEQKAEEAEEY